MNIKEAFQFLAKRLDHSDDCFYRREGHGDCDCGFTDFESFAGCFGDLESETSEHLKPCPFCLHHPPEEHKTKENSPKALIVCPTCGARGPVKGNMFSACNAWNRAWKLR